MMTRSRLRRATALLALAGITNTTGSLGAQAPLRLGGIGPLSPTRIVDCDITVQSCGGSPTFEGGGTGGGGGGGTVSMTPQCGEGIRVECQTRTKEVCLEWIVQDANGKITVGASSNGVGAGGTSQCAAFATTTLYFYLYR